MNISRREFLTVVTAAAASLYVPSAAAMVLPLIIPAIITGIFGVWVMREEREQSAQMHRDRMRLDEANLELARQRQEWEIRKAERDESMQVLLTLIQRDERLAQTVIANSPVLQRLAFNANGQLISTGISNSCDGRGTYLGLERGEIALQRSGYGGTITNQEGVDLGRITYSSGDPVAVPVLTSQSIAGAQSTRWKERIVEKKQLPSFAAFDKDWSLLATRSYSRANRITRNGADVQSVAIVPRNVDAKGNRPVEFHYVT